MVRFHRTAVRRGVAMGAALLTVGALAACSTGGSSADGDTIKIGVDIELSGPAAVQGTAYKNAVELVADKINEDGVLDGKEIELVIRDNKSDPTESLQIAKGMVQNDDVAAIVGGGSSPTTMSILEYVQQAGVPIVSMGSSDAIINPSDEREGVFKTPAGTQQALDVMLARLKKDDVSRVGFISVDNPYGDAGLKAFKESASDAGIEIAGTEKFQDTDKDYTSIVTKLVSEDPEAIIVWAIPPGAGIVAKNIDNSSFDGDVYFDPGAGAELFIKGAGKAANGSLLVHPAVLVADQVKNAPNKDKMQEFYDAYRDEYGEYSGFASYAADALGMIVQAIEDGGSADRESIQKALASMEYTGVTGKYKMTSDDHGGLDPASIVLVTVKDGEWELVDNPS